MLHGRRRHRESCDLLNQDYVLGITNAHESDSSIVMPIDDLPDDLDALRALVSSLSSERDAAIEECRRIREQNDRLHHLLRQLQRAQFGRRSEQLDREQMQLALEDIETSLAEQDAQEDNKDTAETPADTQRKKRHANRGSPRRRLHLCAGPRRRPRTEAA